MKKKDLDAVCYAVRTLKDRLSHDDRVAVAQALAATCKERAHSFDENKFYRGCGL